MFCLGETTVRQLVPELRTCSRYGVWKSRETPGSYSLSVVPAFVCTDVPLAKVLEGVVILKKNPDYKAPKSS